jgi:hypothetical protein
LNRAIDAEAWFVERDVTVEAWYNWLDRRWLRQQNGNGSAAQPEGLAAQVPAEAQHVEGICGGLYGEAARQLATRAALSPEHLEIADPGERKIQLDASFNRHRERQADARVISAAIEAHRFDWMRVDVRTLVFATESAAREGLLCLREDGDSAEGVAARSNALLHSSPVLLEELEPVLRDRLLSAELHQWNGPVAARGGQLLLQVLDKRLPVPDDPGVQTRAKERAFAARVAHEVAQRVSWDFVL